MSKRSLSMFAVAISVSVCGSISLFNPVCGANSQFDRSLQSILPTGEEEVWLQVPWRTNLAEARIEAQRQRKPMFLWVMNGHPLGCT